MRFHSTQTMMVIIKKSDNECQKGHGKLEPSYTAGGNECKMVQPTARPSHQQETAVKTQGPGKVKP